MSNGGRRAELDGVRGVAILLVLFGHAGVPYGLGAFAAAGVTLFFALSGYLITGILVRERERGGIDLRRFYARRMTRLAPPLLVMLAMTGLVMAPGWEALLPALTWTGNYASILGADTTPYGHTWSLGVEEQFYLLWPLVLCVLPRRRAAWVVAGLVVVLMLWRSQVLAEGHYVYGYAALETAGSAILAGAVVALARRRLPGWTTPVGMAGMLLVPVAITAAGESYLVVPLLVTPFSALVVAGASSSRWLAWRPLAACGVVSYSLYLWHEPVSHLVDGGLAPVGVALGALCGLAAYALVEAPIMRARQASTSLCQKLSGTFTSPAASTSSGVASSTNSTSTPAGSLSPA